MMQAKSQTQRELLIDAMSRLGMNSDDFCRRKGGCEDHKSRSTQIRFVFRRIGG